ncbi:hypothetical protein K432DRAFT_425217 [Lepidopterella palustris CBS 459.81]|uniref:Uncharacterized protein n=1 Tax=Lepidopterella palustris CBS 459.81 TaxID=1314670 RepID=A0A8E2JFY6_9PEZI|nr:hypothetical protein K432DRAFT_425217 [Lepidopterella palustris CBS 459.81]
MDYSSQPRPQSPTQPPTLQNQDSGFSEPNLYYDSSTDEGINNSLLLQAHPNYGASSPEGSSIESQILPPWVGFLIIIVVLLWTTWCALNIFAIFHSVLGHNTLSRSGKGA